MLFILLSPALLSSLHFHIQSLFPSGQEMHSMFHVHFPVVLCENKYPGCVHTLVTAICSEEFLILKKQTHLPSINSTDISHFF